MQMNPSQETCLSSLSFKPTEDREMKLYLTHLLLPGGKEFFVSSLMSSASKQNQMIKFQGD
jgi:hypothetical protein